MKKIIIFIIISFFLIPSPSYAFNQRCFTQTICEKVRENQGAPKDQQGFVPKQTECGTIQNAGETEPQPMGYCLSAGEITTQIEIGGKTRFIDIGDYIQTIYKYSIAIAGILSIIIIMIGGVQWLVSGGNTSLISSAKKRIGGALIGLLIAIGSYAILFNINPILTELSSPEVWLLNQIKVAPTYCTEEIGLLSLLKTSSEREAEIKKNLTPDQKNAINLRQFSPNYQITAKEATCGNAYVATSLGNQTCTGSKCKEDNICSKAHDQATSRCWQGNIAGNISSSEAVREGVVDSSFREGWTWPWITDDEDNIEIFSICNDGQYEVTFDTQNNYKTTGYVDVNKYDNSIDINRESRSVFFHIGADESDLKLMAEKYCVQNGGHKGFVLYLDLNELGDPIDEAHFIGKNGIDLGKKSEDVTNCMLQSAPKELFFTIEDFKKGIQINLDVSGIHDIDDNDDMLRYYAPSNPSCF